MDLDATIVREQPVEGLLVPGRVYVERRAGFLKWVHFACPKCGEPIQLPIGAKPDSWSVSVDWLWRPTVRPSVWETESCGAHFFITKGEIRWCAEARSFGRFRT